MIVWNFEILTIFYVLESEKQFIIQEFSNCLVRFMQTWTQFHGDAVSADDQKPYVQLKGDDTNPIYLIVTKLLI